MCGKSVPDCTDLLHRRGMLTKIVETPPSIRNEPPGTHTIAVYRIAPGYTFEQWPKRDQASPPRRSDGAVVEKSKNPASEAVRREARRSGGGGKGSVSKPSARAAVEQER
jgi:hypothetical protein